LWRIQLAKRRNRRIGEESRKRRGIGEKRGGMGVGLRLDLPENEESLSV